LINALESWRLIIIIITIIQETELILTNPRDAIRGQSRSAKMVPSICSVWFPI